MLNNRWQRRMASTIIFVVFLGLFIRYIPWLFNSQSIELVYASGISNLPPPEGAMSFSINQDKALYYDEPVPREAPWQTFIVIIYFAIVIVGAWFVQKKYSAAKDAP
jgi:hypothetical protein